MKVIRSILWWIWLLVDPKGCLLETTTEKEREEMGVRFDD